MEGAIGTKIEMSEQGYTSHKGERRWKNRVFHHHVRMGLFLDFGVLGLLRLCNRAIFKLR